MPRLTVTPGAWLGTRIWEWRLWLRLSSASSPLTPITMKTLQFELIAPLDHHLRPLITYPSPSGVMVVAMLVASLEATSGSVMQKADLIRPPSSGRSGGSRWRG